MDHYPIVLAFSFIGDQIKVREWGLLQMSMIALSTKRQSGLTRYLAEGMFKILWQVFPGVSNDVHAVSVWKYLASCECRS